MIPRRNGVAIPYSTTPEEFRKLWQIRLEAIEDAARALGNGHPVPLPWRVGWKAKLTILGRDRQGCLLGRVEVTTREQYFSYVRNVRLVRPKGLKLHFRDGVAPRMGPHHTEKR